MQADYDNTIANSDIICKTRRQSKNDLYPIPAIVGAVRRSEGVI